LANAALLAVVRRRFGVRVFMLLLRVLCCAALPDPTAARVIRRMVGV